MILKHLKSFICIVLLFTSNLFSIDVSGVYSGAIYNKLTNGIVGTHGAFYRFTDDYKYTLEISSTKYFNTFKIPEQYFDSEMIYEEKGIYRVNTNNALDYIYFSEATPYCAIGKLGVISFSKRLLFLYNGRQLIFDSNFVLKGFDPVMRITDIKTSSYLTEGDIKYDGRNFIDRANNLLRPWVEGISGDGVEEWIEITVDNSNSIYNSYISSLLLANGYVDFDKPYLYLANNRIKQLRIQCIDEGLDFIIELEDTSQLQEVKLPRNVYGKKPVFRLSILEVYKGEKWDDTCLNFIIPIGEVTEK